MRHPPPPIQQVRVRVCGLRGYMRPLHLTTIKSLYSYSNSEMNLAPFSEHFTWKNTDVLSPPALRVSASHRQSEYFWIQHRITFPMNIVNRGWYKHVRRSEPLSFIMFLIHLILTGFYFNFPGSSYICFLR